jgi:hypothetical protein
MKKLLVTAIAVVSAASVFAQGTITFNNYVSGLHTHIYAPLATDVYRSQMGNSSTDLPAGSTVWTGYTLIGAGGLAGQFGGTSTFAALLAAPNTGQTEESLQPTTLGGVVTFHTGAGGGLVINTTTTFNNIPPGGYASGATAEMVVWDNFSGQYSTWALASVAWQNGLIAAAKSGVFNITSSIGGGATAAPNFPSTAFQSFNMYYINVPEPSTIALAGLGAAAVLIFRRRK